MSIHINVHGNANILGDYETCRNAELKRRKLLRLAQVREQSKTLASTVRQRVDDEQRRQIAVIDRIKAEELRAWKAKHGLRSPQQRSEGSATRVGEAHAAAERENAAEVETRKRREQQQRTAAKRGREALARMEKANAERQQAKGQRGVRILGSKKSLATAKVVTHPRSTTNTAAVSTQVGESILEVGGDRGAKVPDVCLDTSTSSSSSSSSSSGVLLVDPPQPNVTTADKLDTPSDISGFELQHRANELAKSLPLAYTKGSKDVPAMAAPIADNPDDAIAHSPICEATDLIRQRRSRQLQQNKTAPVNWFVPSMNAAETNVRDRLPIATAWSAGLRSTDKSPAARNKTSTDRRDNAAPLRQRNASPNQNRTTTLLGASSSARQTRPNLTALQKRANTMQTGASSMGNLASIQSNDLPDTNSNPKEQRRLSTGRDLDESTIGRSAKIQNQTATTNVRDDAQSAEKRFPPELTNQRTLMPEKSREDYELMSAQLAELTKQSNAFAANLNTAPNDDYTEKRLQQLADQRQQHMDAIFKPPTTQPANNVATPAADEVASSLLLDYVDRRSAELETSVRQATDVMPADKYDKLKVLLDRINAQRQQLLHELQPQKRPTSQTNDVQVAPSRESLSTIFQSVQSIEREKRKLLNGTSAAAKTSAATAPSAAADKENVAVRQQLQHDRQQHQNRANIQQREKDVRNKERRVEQKLRQLFIEEQRREQNRENVAHTKTQTERPVAVENHKSVKIVKPCNEDGSQAPVQIIIQVNGGTQYEKRILPGVCVTSQKATMTADPIQNQRHQIPLQDQPKTVYPKTPSKPDRHRPVVPTENIEIDGSSTSTVYHNFPPTIRAHPRNDVRPTTTTKTVQPPSQPDRTAVHQTALGQYIARLLGMSRASVDQLGTSSMSSVDTPSSSIINVPANMGEPNTATLDDAHPMADEQRLEHVQRFIDDNRSFISEVEQSIHEQCQLQQQHSGNETVDESMQRIESLWMKTLAKQESQMRRLKSEGKRLKNTLRHKEVVAPPSIRPILKKPGSPSRLVPLRDQRASKNATDTCNARIAELTEKIERIRREKQRLLESTYSSMGSTGSERGDAQNSTEYQDIAQKTQHAASSKSPPQPPQTASQNSSRASDVVSLAADDDQRSKIAQIQSTATTAMMIGCSRDSGINVTSRPLTASDAHSPDPKSVASSNGTGGGSVEHYAHKTLTIDASVKRTLTASLTAPASVARPPVSIARFAPQIEVLDIPHELSTIAEVDTPAVTARSAALGGGGVGGAPSSTGQQLTELRRLLDISAGTQERLRIRSFRDAVPRLEITNATLEQSMMSSSSTYKMSVTPATVPQIQPFPTHSNYAADDMSGLVGSQTLVAAEGEIDVDGRVSAVESVRMQPYPSHREYAHGVSGLCTSASINAVMDEKSREQDVAMEVDGNNANVEDDKDDDDVESFPDIEAELMRRKLLLRPFARHTSSSSEDYLDANVAMLPANTKAAITRQLPDSSTSTTSVDNLANEMQKIGLNWAGSMIRKTRESARLGNGDPSTGGNDSNSTSSVETATPPDVPTAPRSTPQPQPARVDVTAGDNRNMDNTNHSTVGQPLNLRDFLARELLKRSSSNESSSVHDESTLASQFLRSLLGSSNGSGGGLLSGASPTDAQVLQHTSERHRTSTPVRTMASLSAAAGDTHSRNHAAAGGNASGATTRTPSAPLTNGQLFSGESGMSSVRETSNSASTSASTSHHRQ